MLQPRAQGVAADEFHAAHLSVLERHDQGIMAIGLPRGLFRGIIPPVNPEVVAQPLRGMSQDLPHAGGSEPFNGKFHVRIIQRDWQGMSFRQVDDEGDPRFHDMGSAHVRGRGAAGKVPRERGGNEKDKGRLFHETDETRFLFDAGQAAGGWLVAQ